MNQEKMQERVREVLDALPQLPEEVVAVAMKKYLLTENDDGSAVVDVYALSDGGVYHHTHCLRFSSPAAARLWAEVAR